MIFRPSLAAIVPKLTNKTLFQLLHMKKQWQMCNFKCTLPLPSFSQVWGAYISRKSKGCSAFYCSQYLRLCETPIQTLSISFNPLSVLFSLIALCVYADKSGVQSNSAMKFGWSFALGWLSGCLFFIAFVIQLFIMFYSKSRRVLKKRASTKVTDSSQWTTAEHK